MREREKAQKLEAQRNLTSASSSRAASPAPKTPKKTNAVKSGASTPLRTTKIAIDMAGLHLKEDEEVEEPPKMSLAKEKVMEEARASLESQKNSKAAVSLVVIGETTWLDAFSESSIFSIGHVDAGKSTLTGRLLYELGRLDEKTRISNERGSAKAGKSSFSWAWNLDGTTEERERYANIMRQSSGNDTYTEELRWILRCSHLRHRIVKSPSWMRLGTRTSFQT